MGIPQDGAGVVVAIEAERLSYEPILRLVRLLTGDGTAASAPSRASAREAGTGPAAAFPLGVDGSERRGRKGQKRPRMSADVLGNALAAGEARPDQVVGVATVRLCARRADGSAPVAAGDQEVARRSIAGGEALQYFTAGCVDRRALADEPDRMCAAAGRGRHREPPGEPGYLAPADQGPKTVRELRSAAHAAVLSACVPAPSTS